MNRFGLFVCLVALGLSAAVCFGDDAKLKAVIIDGQNNHNWPNTTPVLRKILDDSGLFSVDVITSPAKDKLMEGFSPQFDKYNVVVLNYNGADWPSETQRKFEQYVNDGGGVVIYHAADNSFPIWKAYNEMIGIGGWGGRDEKSGPMVRVRNGKVVLDNTPGPGGTHSPPHDFQIVMNDKEHPITAGLPEKWMHPQDELYSKLRGSAENMTVLASAYADPNLENGTGEYEPMLMAISYGRGRVFHTALGHDTYQMSCVGFIVTLQRGAEWAATGKVTQKVPADFPTADKISARAQYDVKPAPATKSSSKADVKDAIKEFDAAVAGAAKYDYGQSREELSKIEGLEKDLAGDPALRKHFEQKLLEVFKAKESSMAMKQFACKQLSLIGSEESVPSLAAALCDANTSYFVRYAIERIGGESGGKALVNALGCAKPAQKAAIIDSLGQMRYAKAVANLGKLAGDLEKQVAEAAIAALGKIGNAEAADALAGIVKSSSELKLQAWQAYIEAASRLADSDKTKAYAMYKKAFEANLSDVMRIAAMRGMFFTSDNEAGQLIVKVLKGKDEAIKPDAIKLACALKSTKELPAICDQMKDLSSSGQVQMITAISNFDTSQVHETVVKAAESWDVEVRTAAIKALAKVGKASDVAMLAKNAAQKDSSGKIAQGTFYTLKGTDIDEAILLLIPKTEGSVKVELIKSIGQRNIKSGMEAVRQCMKDPDAKVRTASIRALGTIADARHFKDSLNLLVNADAGDRVEFEQAIFEISKRADSEQSGYVLEALAAAKEPGVKCSLLSVLGKMSNDKTLDNVYASLKVDDESVQTAAVRALSEWQTCGPAQELLKIAKGTNPTQQVLAFRGYIRIIGVCAGSDDDKALKYKEAMAFAGDSSEKKRVLAGLSSLKTMAALKLANEYVDANDLRQEAGTAAITIAQSTIKTEPNETKVILNKIAAVVENVELKEQAQKMLKE